MHSSRTHVAPTARVLATLTVITLSTALTPADSSAQTAPKIHYACYVPGSGTVYRIKEPNTPHSCNGSSHVEFSWTDGANSIHVGDAAGGDLTGTYPNPTVAKLQGRAVSNLAPANAQALVWDGLTTQWKPSGVDHGALTGLGDDDHQQYLRANGVRFALNGFATTGTFGSGFIPVEGPGTRFMWYPGKAALRAGTALDEWNDANIGFSSIALGHRTKATGISAVALGQNALATGDNSMALGINSKATGATSAAFGHLANAGGVSSTALGLQAEAFGDFATAIHRGKATGSKAMAIFGGLASGELSIAIGNSANTNGQTNSIVISNDGSLTPAIASGQNQFVVRALGGAFFYASNDLSTGVVLPNGAGAWSTASDVNRKENFRTVDGEKVLAKIAEMPVTEWNYKAQGDSIRHLGPMAQDFYKAFGLGESNVTITTTDIDGINLVAAQALEKRTAVLDRESRSTRAELAALRSELEATRQALAALKAEVDALRGGRVQPRR